MRRTTCLVLAGGLAALLAPVSADAQVLDVFQRLAGRGLSPPPLVPTTVPPRFRPIDRTIQGGPGRRRGAYLIRLEAFVRGGAIIAIEGGAYRSMRAALRDHRGESRSAIRVRGRRGFLFTTLRRDAYSVVWSEGGRVYAVGTGTTRNVSVRQLRALVAGLEPLGSSYGGGSSDPQKSSGAEVVTTRRTITVYLEFEANCTFTPHAGQAQVVLMPLRGNSFSFDVARNRRGSAPWNGTVSGTVAADAVTLDYQVSGTIGGESCSGAETLRLPRH